MKIIFPLLTSLGFALVACSGGGSSKSGLYHPDVGPFDENGDYVEALADAPVRKNFFSRSRKKPKALVAQVEAKPAPSRPSRPVRSAPSTPSQTVVISRTQKPKVAPTRPKVSPKPKAKPKAVVVKPKKAAPRRHRVVSSDTLYGLSRRYGVSVGAIQRANGLKGTIIGTGSTLLIPR